MNDEKTKEHEAETDAAPDRDGQDIGIYVPPQIRRHKRLTPAAKLVGGQVLQLTKKNGFCFASNNFIAHACGVNRDTVSVCLKKLAHLGLIRITTEGDRRRIFPVDCGIIPQTSSAESIEGSAESIGDLRKKAEPPAEKGLGHLNIQEKKQVNEDEEDERSCSSSSSCFLERDAASVLNPSLRSTTAPDLNYPQAFAVAKDWAFQTVCMMRKRVWKRRLVDGSEPETQLEIPSVSIPSRAEVDQLVDLAVEIWPGSDPIMALRQLLRSAAWTADRRDKLQQHAYLAASGSLTIRALLKLGGQQDPLGFARDVAGSVPPPPPATALGTPAEAEQLRRLAYDSCQDWSAPAWAPCWLDAAGRCTGYFRLPPQFYMAAAFSQYEADGMSVPLPWLADSLTGDYFQKFGCKYVDDRKNAWSGGPCRSVPGQLTGDYSLRVGRDIADAVAQGKRPMRSRACLLCAAGELRLLPALVQYVNWNDSADKLADLLENLASQTDQDDPPIRSVACGQKDCDMPSYIRCPYGNVRGVYIAPCDKNPMQHGQGDGNVPTAKVERPFNRAELLASLKEHGFGT